ncbi:hypothetical protein ACLKMH_01705 [Psychromonas sp. KJ10-10]|uniref:hypothetical protein n=1 Tax=Psychromonas sp. KJ10-10 TaxID=3391823 RepID=UPI0039B57298
MGNDLDTHTSEQPFENEIRLKALSCSQIKLHINLHGYPSHEWVRPFSGYIPKGFEKWTLPKGFFLILRYADDEIYQTCGRELLCQLTKRLSNIPQLCTFNKRQLEQVSMHVGENDLKVLNNIPCIITKVSKSMVPLQLISEFPDETLYGEHFQFAHTVQKMVVLEAYNIYQALNVP